MKIDDERANLEKLLDEAPDKIAENVPTPGNIPEELQTQSVMNINFSELREKCEGEARIMINNAIAFILTDENLENNAYLRDKLEVDVMSLSGMIYQLRVNEAMQRAMMEEVDRGFMQPRMFEVFSGLSKTIAEINKQLLGTVEAIKSTYKDVKNDIREKETDALGGSKKENGMLTHGDGGVITMGTKELINSVKQQSKRQSQEPDDIEEIQ